MTECIDIEVLTSSSRPPNIPVFNETEEADFQRCAFCGCLLEDPCEEPPPDYCERAINATYAKDLFKTL